MLLFWISTLFVGALLSKRTCQVVNGIRESHHFIHCELAHPFARLLNETTTLRVLEIGLEGFDVDEVQDFLSALQKNKHLYKVTLDIDCEEEVINAILDSVKQVEILDLTCKRSGMLV
jgi:hypothetical protein